MAIALAAVVEQGEAAPTEQDFAVFADLSRRLDRELAGLEQLLSRDLPALNGKLTAAHLPAIERRPEPAVEPGMGVPPGIAEDGEEGEAEDE